MKHLFSAITFLIVTTLAKSSDAQSNKEIAFDNIGSIIDLPTNSINKNPPETKATYIKVTLVKIDAVRDFIRYHKNVSDERWFKIKDGYIVNFLSKGIDKRI